MSRVPADSDRSFMGLTGGLVRLLLLVALKMLCRVFRELLFVGSFVGLDLLLYFMTETGDTFSLCSGEWRQGWGEV